MTMRFLSRWRKDLALAAFAASLLVAQPILLEAQKCGDENHYHDGADHCDSGGDSCTVVCP